MKGKGKGKKKGKGKIKHGASCPKSGKMKGYM